MFKNTKVEVPDVIGVDHSSWFSNPFFRGSWGYNTTPTPTPTPAGNINHHDKPDDIVTLSQMPLGIGIGSSVKKKEESILLYAGECMHEQYDGTLHGAYLSGVNAAVEIVMRASSS
jgi:hypothetical protein